MGLQGAGTAPSRDPPEHRAPREQAEALDETGAFQDWPPQTVAALASVSRVRSFSRGEVLLRQGQVADQFFVMLKGMVTVRKSVDPAQELRDEAARVAHQLEQLREGYVYHRRLRPSLAAHMGSVESLQVLAAEPPEDAGPRHRKGSGDRASSAAALPPLHDAGGTAADRGAGGGPVPRSSGQDTESKGACLRLRCAGPQQPTARAARPQASAG